jgi:hypothetical protein
MVTTLMADRPAAAITACRVRTVPTCRLIFDQTNRNTIGDDGKRSIIACTAGLGCKLKVVPSGDANASGIGEKST